MLRQNLFLLRSIAIILGILPFLSSCDDTQDQLNELEVYEGAFHEVEGLNLWYSDSAIVILMVEAQRLLEFENGDREYPEGIYVEFYGKDKVTKSTLKADHAFYTKKTDLYRAVGNVKLVSLEKNQKLSTEELFWSAREKQVYTEKFVIIETEEDVLHGEGLTAAQDFSTYRILKPTGELGLD